ncbi:MAG: hypothetical protein ABIJ15_04565 [bacterium]
MIEFWKEKLPEKVFITPIDAVLKGIKKEILNCRQIGNNNWWPGFTGSYNSKKTCIINCGRGESAGDCVLFLKDMGCREIIFFGFAGSINKEFRPGDVCALGGSAGGMSFADFLKDDIKDRVSREKIRNFPGGEGAKSAVVYTVPSIFRENEIYGCLAERGFDLVDMETANILQAGSGMRLRFFYYVTDYKLKFDGRIDFEKIKTLCLKSV